MPATLFQLLNRSYMNQIYGFMMLSILLLASCKKDKDDAPSNPDYHLNVSTATVQLPAAAGSFSTVDVTANSAWKVSLPAGVDWISVNKTTGTGNDNVKITVTQANNNPEPRTAIIKFELENGKAPAKQVTVTQDFAPFIPVSVVWKKVLGGNGNDYGYSIIKTPDGGHLLSGRTSSNNNGDVGPTKGGIDMWVVKLDASGAISWQKTFGGQVDEYSVAAASTPDGGYVLTGYTTSTNTGDVGQNHGNTDFWVIKINGNGILQWQKTIGGNADDRPNAITVTSDGKIAVAGYSTSNNNGDVSATRGWEDMWVVVLDNATGSFVWKKTFGGNGSDIAKAIVPATDGGLFVGGTTSSNNNGDAGPGKGSTDFWILRLDQSGSIVWKNSLGGSNSESLQSIALGPNNTLVASGSTKSNNSGDVGQAIGGEDMWVVQLNATTGSLNWQKVLGGNGIDMAKGILARDNGSVIISGYTYSNNSGDVATNNGAGEYWIVQLKPNGNTGWKKLLGGDDEDLAFSIADAGNGGFVVAGYTLSKDSGDVGPAHGNSDVWVVKLQE